MNDAFQNKWIKQNKSVRRAAERKGCCEGRGEGWKGHRHAARLGGKQPIWSCSTNMMGSVWPQIAQGSGILMPQHTLLHTRAPRAFCILMTQPYERNRANKVAIFGKSVGNARAGTDMRVGGRWLVRAPALTHFAFQIKGSLETLERDLGLLEPCNSY